MPGKIEELCAAVLKQVTPIAEKREEIGALAKKLERRVAKVCRESKLKARVRLEGSVAKDTWLSEEPDIDIFMRVPKTIPRTQLGETCLKIARRATHGSRQVERFAEHPYLEAFLDGTRVNIVPCYDAKKGEWQSATDRTPFHTDYANKQLTAKLRGEVRLLKKFMKGTSVYGAEIRTGGFSGYLCELLVLQHRSFVNVLKAFAHLKGRMVVDIESHYEGRRNELNLLFTEPLVVVDPVDRARNAASAVQAHKLHTLRAAAQAFLKDPSTRFFYPRDTVPLAVGQLKQELAEHESALLFVLFGNIDAVPDVLWGQLYKSQRSLSKLLATNDFNVLRHTAWSDEQAFNMFLFELEQRALPPVKKHIGPPLDRERECDDFLKKYMHSSGVVSGPYVDDGRWVVELRRKCPQAVDLLKERLGDGGRNAGVAEKISQVLRRGFRILVNEEIAEAYEENSGFAKFLIEFLSGKPKWLETAHA